MKHSARARVAAVSAGAVAAVVATGALAAWAIIAAVGPAGRSPTTSANGRTLPARSAARAPTPGAVSTSTEQSSQAPITATDSVPSTTQPTPKPIIPTFQSSLAMRHVRYLSRQIGRRREGTIGERRAAVYLAGRLRSHGYRVWVQSFPLPGGRQSRNLIALKKGASPARIVLGAHYDTKGPSPGANDNASGAAAVIELARVFRNRDTRASIQFVLLGAEEMVDANPDHHHYGSRYFVRQLSAEQRAGIAAMVSVDMIGYGDEFCVRTMGRGPRELSDVFRRFARTRRVGLVYRRDPGRFGWSDHEPFELMGIPAVWLEWREDPVYHSAGDVASHLRVHRIQRTGGFLQTFLTTLSRADLEMLQAANSNR